MQGTMLRPSNSLLGSSRGARRAHRRAERRKLMGRAVGQSFGLVGDLWGTALDLVLLVTLPLLYLAASYLLLDLPLRWLLRREPATLPGGAELLLALIVSLVGIARSRREAEPVAPVRPAFARAMLGLGWVAALLLTIGDLAA
jgi:hypothetical protein